MATITIGRVLDASTDSVSTKELNQLVPVAFDHMDFTYSGSDIVGVVYKQGGAGGTVVATLTLTYSSPGVLSSVTRS